MSSYGELAKAEHIQALYSIVQQCWSLLPIAESILVILRYHMSLLTKTFGDDAKGEAISCKEK
jgi:DNA-binding transcriptional regulator PaaX